MKPVMATQNDVALNWYATPRIYYACGRPSEAKKIESPNFAAIVLVVDQYACSNEEISDGEAHAERPNHSFQKPEETVEKSSDPEFVYLWELKWSVKTSDGANQETPQRCWACCQLGFEVEVLMYVALYVWGYPRTNDDLM